RPIYALCCKYLRGFFRIILFIETTIGLVILFIAPALLIENWEWTLATLILLPAGYLVDHIFPPFFEFRRWPTWFTTFFAAQISIQLGMLFLTAFYFKKISVAAAMANFVAIPLIGIIVQLGLFAGIITTLPFIGPWIALCLNATNWLCIKLFLTTAHFFGNQFPYPDVSPPKPSFLFVYYFVLLLIAAWPWLKINIEPRIRYILINWRKPLLFFRLGSIMLLMIILASQALIAMQTNDPRLKLTIFEPTMSFMGGGNAILIQTPENHNFLVDAGPRYVLRKKQPIPIMVGEKTIIPALLDLGARKLDGMIISSAKDSYAGGAASIINNPSFAVDTVYHAFPFTRLEGDESTDDVLKMLQDPVLFESNRRRRSELTAWSLQDLFSALRDRGVPLVAVKSGNIIHSETITVKGKSRHFELKVINPPKSRYVGRYSSGSNSIVLQIDYGECRILLTSDISKSVQSDLLESGGHLADVIQLPSNGAQFAYNPEFIGEAEIAFVAPFPSRYTQKNLSGILASLENSGTKTYTTNQGGAITITTNGQDLIMEQFVSDKPEVIRQ
ncbi:ComEC/Rec2 family competence protein, partial [bacterium]|nr:ComEC/Rec2 family competence protein [bacterium]